MWHADSWVVGFAFSLLSIAMLDGCNYHKKFIYINWLANI